MGAATARDTLFAGQAFAAFCDETAPTMPMPFEVGAAVHSAVPRPTQGADISAGPLPVDRLVEFLKVLPREAVQQVYEAAGDVLGESTRPTGFRVVFYEPGEAAGQTAPDVVPLVGLMSGKKVTKVPFPIEAPTDIAGALASAEAQSAASGPPAFRAFKELGQWLDATDQAVADAVGIGRTTVYSWKRQGAEPRRGTAQRIYEFHSILSSLLRRLGDDGLRTWLFGGNPSPRQLMLAGDLEGIESRVHDVLFRPRETGVGLGWEPEPEVDSKTTPGEDRDPAARPSARKVKRARLS